MCLYKMNLNAYYDSKTHPMVVNVMKLQQNASKKFFMFSFFVLSIKNMKTEAKIRISPANRDARRS